MAKLPKTNDADNSTAMVIAERIIIVTAPAGPRRRAGLSFDKTPVELKWDDLGDDPETTVELLRTDPFLKLDGRMEERPATEDEQLPPSTEA